MESTFETGGPTPAALESELAVLIAAQVGCPVAQVVPAARLRRDLAMDSLDVVELTMTVEERYGIDVPEARLDNDLSVAEVVALVADCRAAQARPAAAATASGRDPG